MNEYLLARNWCDDAVVDELTNEAMSRSVVDIYRHDLTYISILG